MTDKANAAFGPHEPEQGSPQSYRAKQIAEAPEDESDFSSLYDSGLAALKARGFTMKRSPVGTHCLHNCYIRSAPRQLAGISYPPHFKVLRQLETELEEKALISALTSDTALTADVQQFWLPVSQPMNGSKSTALQGFTERMLSVDSNRRQQNESLPFELGIQISNFTAATAAKDTPRAFIPPREWFAPEVQRLEFSDIFTLWPEPEQRFLQLILGRGLAGRAGSQLIGEERILEHTFRSVGIIVGEDAGLGKSTIFNKLFAALNAVGYVRYNFRDISERFGLASVAESDFAYKDDLTSKSLGSLVSSENLKIIASGGQMLSEDKFAKATNLFCRTVVLANTNEFDPRMVYSLDSGIADRIKLLSTLRKSELLRLVSPRCPESPGLQPFVHLPWLAQNLGVAEETLLLWAARLAVDRFMEFTSWRGDVPTEALMNEVHDLTSRLRCQFHKDATRSLISGMVFADILMRHLTSKKGLKTEYQLPELSTVQLKLAFESFRKLVTDKNYYRVRSLLKLHWELNNRPDSHPWTGIRKLNFGTVPTAANLLAAAIQSREPLSSVVKQVFSSLTLRDGFVGSSDGIWVCKGWETCRTDSSSIETLARRVLKVVEDNCETGQDFCEVYDKRFSDNHKAGIEDAWLNDEGYSPKLVEAKLSEQSEGFDVSKYESAMVEAKWV